MWVPRTADSVPPACQYLAQIYYSCMLHAQPGRCLYTTVRELVENSLDASESIGMLPDIDVEMCVRLLLGFLRFVPCMTRPPQCATKFSIC